MNVKTQLIIELDTFTDMANICASFLFIIFKRWGCIKKISKILEFFPKISTSPHFWGNKGFCFVNIKCFSYWLDID